jgi:hypothetical protein
VVPLNVRRRKGKAQVTKREKKKAAEVTRLGYALRSLGGLAGGAVGGLVGMPSVGSGLGTGLGAALSRWLGSGDYTVRSNSVLKAGGTIPAMHKQGQSITVRHREYICEIIGTTAFTVFNTFPLNPGLSGSFPWLARVANCYQEYRVKGMVYHYIPTSGNAVSATNSALGSVMIQTSYRSTDTAPTSKVEVLNEYWASETVPSQELVHPIECDGNENPFKVQYVRSGTVPTGDSQLMYDLGTTYVCTSGMQGSNVVGDLWVTYEVELKKPLMSSNVTSTTGLLYGISLSTDASNLFTGMTYAIGNLTVTATANTITFPQGLFGQFNVYIEVEATTSFTTQTWANTFPTATNLVAAPINASAVSLTRITNSAACTLNRACYKFACIKADASTVGTAVIPTPTFTGAILRTYMEVYQFSDA